MGTNDQRVRDLIEERAAEWFVENRAGLDAEQRHEFAAWLKASPVHVEEYLAVAALAQDLPGACEPAEETRDQLVERARREEHIVQRLWPTKSAVSRTDRAVRPRRSRAFAVAASLSVLGVGLLAAGHHWSNTRHPIAAEAIELHFQSGHGEQQTRHLADHSVIHLNTDTAVTVRFDDHERLVVLEAGEADFEVAHEAHRAFRVFAGTAEVIDVGTQFDVRLGPAATLVTVVAGKIDVALMSDTRRTMPIMQLVAGQQIRVAEGGWPARPVTVDVERTTGWLHRQIKFDNEPLARVMSEFNRYASKPFEITTPVLRDLKISGVFATDDTDAFIAFLRSLRGVHVEVTTMRILVSQH